MLRILWQFVVATAAAVVVAPLMRLQINSFTP